MSVLLFRSYLTSYNYYQFPSRNAMLKVYEKLKKRYIIQVILHSCALAERRGP